MLQESVKNNLLSVHFPYLPLLCGPERHGCSALKPKWNITPVFAGTMFLRCALLMVTIHPGS